MLRMQKVSIDKNILQTKVYTQELEMAKKWFESQKLGSPYLEKIKLEYRQQFMEWQLDHEIVVHELRSEAEKWRAQYLVLKGETAQNMSHLTDKQKWAARAQVRKDLVSINYEEMD